FQPTSMPISMQARMQMVPIYLPHLDGQSIRDMQLSDLAWVLWSACCVLTWQMCLRQSQRQRDHSLWLEC
ncbi:hypothetical protein IW150_005582, partial [Coemansia sp. RSA 2607]